MEDNSCFISKNYKNIDSISDLIKTIKTNCQTAIDQLLALGTKEDLASEFVRHFKTLDTVLNYSIKNGDDKTIYV